jgi:hypothetical protein
MATTQRSGRTGLDASDYLDLDALLSDEGNIPSSAT